MKDVMPIDRESVQKFLLEVDAEIVSAVGASAAKLHGFQKLISKYHAERDAWLNGRVVHIRGITSFVNEMAFAKLILDDPKVREAHYEKGLEGTGKTMDFLAVLVKNEARIFYDVKTIQPESLDAWNKYKKFEESGWFTLDTELELEEEGLGGEIAHDLFASRRKFLDYTLELEEKIRAMPNENGNRFCLVFCGDGIRWRRDHLEDFADFYFSGQCRQDDSLGSMQSHHMMEKGKAFDRSIHGFCYFERKICSPNPTVFQCGIRGPRIPWENPQ